ncbi:hypothetical protein F3K34_21300 [Streptomyces sp. LBUM 1486]|nr:hypothetical protein [Streptomyces sp. LBUM 1485]MBP5891461.1 hypothetical protein [Streptomyces sp. LBUM 1481]MBP5914673.1 hypothetical protein [Streptomyces sp. LBUM 1486]MBP5921615.1 hypothetical protein [Streptomyces sp. LBUM 1483]QTU55900.1 hypothetical protein F3K21_26370 [Streptomyces sp. LBUM 1480]
MPVPDAVRGIGHGSAGHDAQRRPVERREGRRLHVPGPAAVDARASAEDTGHRTAGTPLRGHPHDGSITGADSGTGTGVTGRSRHHRRAADHGLRPGRDGVGNGSPFASAPAVIVDGRSATAGHHPVRLPRRHRRRRSLRGHRRPPGRLRKPRHLGQRRHAAHRGKLPHHPGRPAGDRLDEVTRRHRHARGDGP